MRSETLPEEYATDAILAIDYDRWETVGAVENENYCHNFNVAVTQEAEDEE